MSIKLNRGGEPLIDYLKAICIIMVVISYGTGSALLVYERYSIKKIIFTKTI